jgi:hypothetical protein
MKSLFLRSSVALACALSLAACGGGSGNLLLGGQVTGLTTKGLVLQNNLGPKLTVEPGVNSFGFVEPIREDEGYDVTIAAQPADAKCTVSGGKGKAGAFNVNTVVVSCVTDTRPVGGPVVNLTTNGLVVINGSDQQSIPAGATSFTMDKPVTGPAPAPGADPAPVPGQVPIGAPYGITVLKQPADHTCTVQNGSGTMTKAGASNVIITCT